MQNRILHLTRNIIPYIRELQPLAGSTSGCILMQQLDYWFHRHPNGFWKFLEPSSHQKYKQGDSWTEELGISCAEFRTAFDRIGTRHKSKSEFDLATDKFAGKFYCSYLDRRENLTFYFRNDSLLDEALDNIISDKQCNTVNKESSFTVNKESGFTANEKNQSTEMKKVNLQEIEKVDVDITNTTSHTLQQLVIPSQLGSEELKTVFTLLKQVPVARHQELLDELQGAIVTSSIRKGKIQFFRSLVKSVQLGGFVPSAGVSIRAARNQKAQREKTDFENESKFLLDPTLRAKGSKYFTNGHPPASREHVQN
ncbi:MAG: hypothetical protein PHI29_01545 [Gallionella sp.]|nr:hypothetical protein [Gallionella sp.]